MMVTPKEVQEMLSFFVVIYTYMFMYVTSLFPFPPCLQKKMSRLEIRETKNSLNVYTYVWIYVCDLSAYYVCT